MTLTQVKYFMEVASCLSFTEAARRLYVSQQVVSKQVGLLEDELGVQLFDRSGRQVTLTESGRILAGEWADIQTRIDETFRRVSEAGRRQRVRLRIGVCELCDVIDRASRLFAAYASQHPEVELEYEVYPFKTLQEMLQRGELDLIYSVSSEVLQLPGSYRVRTLAPLHLAIILSSLHPLAQREKLDIMDIRSERFYFFSDVYSSVASTKIIEHCRWAGYMPASIKYFHSVNAMEVALCGSRGVTVGFPESFRSIGTQLKSFPIHWREDWPQETVVAAWNGGLASRLEGRLELSFRMYHT